MDSIDALKLIIRTEKKELEDKAFGIYCKRELSIQIDRVDKDKLSYDSSVNRLESLTLDKLKIDFESYNCSMSTPKEQIIKELENKT